MTAAMKASDHQRLDPLRMIKAALMKYKVDMMKPADDASIRLARWPKAPLRCTPYEDWSFPGRLSSQ